MGSDSMYARCETCGGTQGAAHACAKTTADNSQADEAIDFIARFSAAAGSALGMDYSVMEAELQKYWIEALRILERARASRPEIKSMSMRDIVLEIRDRMDASGNAEFVAAFNELLTDTDYGRPEPQGREFWILQHPGLSAVVLEKPPREHNMKHTIHVREVLRAEEVCVNGNHSWHRLGGIDDCPVCTPSADEGDKILKLTAELARASGPYFQALGKIVELERELKQQDEANEILTRQLSEYKDTRGWDATVQDLRAQLEDEKRKSAAHLMMYDRIMKENEQLGAQLDTAREALKYFADHEMYKTFWVDNGVQRLEMCEPVMTNGLDIAREALAKLERPKGEAIQPAPLFNEPHKSGSGITEAEPEFPGYYIRRLIVEKFDSCSDHDVRVAKLAWAECLKRVREK